MDIMRKFLFITLSIIAVNANAASFEDISKGFVIIASSTGKNYLSAAVKFDDGVYAVTSQSLFLNPISQFRLKTFSGKKLKQIAFEVDPKADFVRIKLGDSSDLTPLEPAPDQSGKKYIFRIDPSTSVIYMRNADGEKFNRQGATCSAGAPVVNKNGEFVGVASRVDFSVGQNKQFKLALLDTEANWLSTKSFLFSKQVYSLHKLMKFTLALDYTRDNHKRGRYIAINSDTYPTLMGFTKEHNQKVFDTSLIRGRRKKGAKGKALREHQALCFSYSNWKRLAAYYSSNAITVKKRRWYSAYLKQRAKSLFESNNSSFKKIKAEMKIMVKKNPSIKAK